MEGIVKGQVKEQPPHGTCVVMSFMKRMATKDAAGKDVGMQRAERILSCD